MKRLLFLSVLLAFLIPFHANADHFKCDLNLYVIADTDSSEQKQLIFDIDLKHDQNNIMSGSMITSSCFNRFVDPYVSNSSVFKKVSVNDLIHGVVSSPDLAIGKYNYQLGLNFAQIAGSDDGVITFRADGKLLPLNNEEFIHQNVEGECYLSDGPLFSPGFQSMPMNNCKDNNELQ